MRINKIELVGTELMTMLFLVEKQMDFKLKLLTDYSYKPELKAIYTKELLELKALHTKLKHAQLN